MIVEKGLLRKEDLNFSEIKAVSQSKHEESLKNLNYSKLENVQIGPKSVKNSGVLFGVTIYTKKIRGVLYPGLTKKN